MKFHQECSLFVQVVGSGCVVDHASGADCSAQLTASNHAVSSLQSAVKSEMSWPGWVMPG